MAKVVETNNRYVYGAHNWVRVGLIGAALGVVILVLSWLLGTYVIDPLLCRSGTLAACGRSDVLAGNVAAVVGAVIGTGLLIRLRTYRSLWVTLATLIAFWGISELVGGLRWAESAAWMAVLYGLAYLLFAHILRIRSIFIALVLTALAVLVLRWVAFL